jgi:hypothetical protein
MNHWIICPFNSEFPVQAAAIWEAGRNQGFISIGWSRIGNVIGKSHAEIQTVIDKCYPGKSPRGGATVWSFLNDIQVGDTIVARSGLSRVLGIGRVVRAAFYDPDLCPIGREVDDPHCLFIGVDWDVAFKPRTMGKPRYFGIGTLHPLSESKLNEIRATSIPAETIPVGPLTTSTVERMEDDIATSEFGELAFEKHLEQFLVDHFERIFGPSLVIYRNPDREEYGQQFPTDIGRIDILAYNPSEKTYVVIELKKGRESDVVVGQIARYMGWVKQHLCQSGESVKGMIICADSNDRMRYSALAVPNLDVRHYQIDFRLRDAGPPSTM